MSLSERLFKYAETIITLSQYQKIAADLSRQIQERLPPPKDP